MYIGESCMVRYPDGDRFTWYNAKIKTIQKHTVSVIWIEGEYRGSETYKIPTSELFLDETKNDMVSMKKNIQQVKDRLDSNSHMAKAAVDLITPLLKGILEKLDDLNKKLDTAKILFKEDMFDEDEVNYDLERLKTSLDSLGSVHMYTSSGSIDIQEANKKTRKKKYYSTPEFPLYVPDGKEKQRY